MKPPMTADSEKKIEGLSLEDFEQELDKLHNEAKQDPHLRAIGEAAGRILNELLTEGVG